MIRHTARAGRMPASLLVLAAAAAPAAADGWSATAELSPPLAGTYDFSGLRNDDYDSESGEPFHIAGAYLGPDVARGTPCAEADTILLDVLFGNADTLEIQFLFDLLRGPDGAWTVDEPSSFYNAGTRDDNFLVNIEVYEGSRVTLGSVTCADDETLALSFDYAFTGGSETGKGPTELTVTGSYETGGLSLFDYSAY